MLNIVILISQDYVKGILVGKSWEMAKIFQDKSVRFIFIDAGHSYEAVTKDIMAWYPKIHPEGLLCGHDWFSSENIRGAVIDCARNLNKQIATTSSCWALI